MESRYKYQFATNVNISNKVSFLEFYWDVNTGWHMIKSFIKPFQKMIPYFLKKTSDIDVKKEIRQKHLNRPESSSSKLYSLNA